MTAERNSNNLSGALFFISGIFFGAALGLGAAELMKDPSIITNPSKQVFPELTQKRRVA